MPPCDCAICTLLREEFGAEPGQEHEVIADLVESLETHRQALNDIDEKHEEMEQMLGETEFTLTRKQIKKEQVAPENVKSGVFVEQAFDNIHQRKLQESEENNE